MLCMRTTMAAKVCTALWHWPLYAKACKLKRPPTPPCCAGTSADAATEAFYYGRAFVQTLGERVGGALGEFLSEAGRKDAERQRAIRHAPSPSKSARTEVWRLRLQCLGSAPVQPPGRCQWVGF